MLLCESVAERSALFRPTEYLLESDHAIASFLPYLMYVRKYKIRRQEIEQRRAQLPSQA
jgi:hypothetical protein